MLTCGHERVCRFGQVQLRMRFLHLKIQEDAIRSRDDTTSIMLRRKTSCNKCHAPEEDSLTERDLGTHQIRCVSAKEFSDH